MTIALRLVSAWLLLNALAFPYSIWKMAQSPLTMTTAIIILAELVLLAAAGAGSVGLWRLRESGRRAALAYLALYLVAVGVIWYRLGRLDLVLRFAAAWIVAVGAFLLTPPVRRACAGPPPS